MQFVIGHSTHRDGHGVDIRSDKVGAMEKNSSDNNNYSKDKTVIFVKKAIKKGFKYILTLCPHVTKECNKDAELISGIELFVNQVNGHHNHLHMDFWTTGSNVLDDHISRAYCSKCSLYITCSSKYKKGKNLK